MNNQNQQHEVADATVMSIIPIVSVFMVTYNHRLYLAQAIEGVIAQKTDFPIELVIGEDCSSDNTREIALDYQRRYPQLIRVIYSDINVGAEANGIRVIRACRGKFVAFCDGDDYWVDPKKLQAQVDILSKFNEIDICIHSCYRKSVLLNNETLFGVRSSSDCTLTLGDMITDEKVIVPSASMLIRRNVLMSISTWIDETKPPGGDFFIQVFASMRGGAYYLNKPMSVYRTDVPGSWTQTLNTNFEVLLEKDIQFFDAIKKMESLISGQKDAFNHKYIYYYSRLINYKNEKLARMEKLIPPMVEHIYGQKNAATTNISRSAPFNWSDFAKFAFDCAKAAEINEQKADNPIYWQLLRVSRTLLVYTASNLKMLKTHYSNKTEYEKIIAKWKMEAQKQFLIARWNRLINLINE